MTKESKRMIYLLSELVRPSVEGINLFRESLQEDQVKDAATGKCIPIFKWTQPVSNGSKKTGNGNLFPKADVEPAILSPFVQDRITRNCFYNEFQHPTRDNPERYMQVYDQYVSDKITKMWYESVNGEDILMANCETATYSYGDDLRRKILSGAIPAKSLRGAGEVYMDASGRERKSMRIVAYDNVFMPADSSAWGDMGTLEKSQYAESLYMMADKMENNAAINSRKFFIESVIDLGYHFEEIHNEMQFIAESLGDDVRKVAIDKDRNIIGYYGNKVTTYTTIGESLKSAVNDFFNK